MKSPLLLLLSVAVATSACGSETSATTTASAAGSAKPAASTKPSASSAASSAPSQAPSSAPSAASSASVEACPKDNTPPTLEFVDVKFEWTETPKLADAPKDKVFANVGEKTFVIPKVEVWVSEADETVTLRTHDAVLLGPSLVFKGKAKAGAEFEDKWGVNRGYFQTPLQGFTAECSAQTLSVNGMNARAMKLTKYDASSADGSFITTWRDDKRLMWAAGTFKDAKVIVLTR